MIPLETVKERIYNSCFGKEDEECICIGCVAERYINFIPSAELHNLLETFDTVRDCFSTSFVHTAIVSETLRNYDDLVDNS